MDVRVSQWAVCTLAAALVASCVLADVTLANRACPCITGWQCIGGVCVATTASPNGDVDVTVDVPSRISIAQGGSASLRAELKGGATAPVRVSVVTLPPGLTATPPSTVLFGATTSQSITVNADEATPIGDASASLELQFEGTERRELRPLTVGVRGKPGKLDASFGVGGRVSFGPLVSDFRGAKLARRKDGSVVVAWTAFTNDTALPARCRVVVLGAAGESSGFVPHGPAVDDPAGCVVRDMLVDDQDGLVLVTTLPVANDQYADQAISRHHFTGSLDTSFGSGGVVHTTMKAQLHDRVGGRAVLTGDGHIVLRGSIVSSTDVVAYDRAGALDGTFGQGGIANVVVEYGDGLYGLPDDARLLSAVADCQPGLPLVQQCTRLSLSRLQRDGALDSNFGDAGALEFERPLVGATPIVGTFLASGAIVSVTADSARRFDPMGHIDKAFGVDGAFALPEAYAPLALAFDGAGELLVLRYSGGARDPFLLTRLAVDGAIDVGFGAGGSVLLGVRGVAQPTAMRVDPDGILIALTAFVAQPDDASTTVTELVLLRYYR